MEDMTRKVKTGFNSALLPTKEEFAERCIDDYINYCLKYRFDQYDFADLPTLTNLVCRIRSSAEIIFETAWRRISES